MDVALAVVQAVLCLPAWILVPLAIRLEDGGPVFHAQERVGRRGRLFRSWKFRSMTPRQEEDAAPRQAGLEEHRVTRVGALLRATALDELPQIWNILVGDMSYVGPRALLPEERSVAEDGGVVRLEDLPGYGARHRVRPGLTGLAQVQLPRDAPHRQKFRLDVLYVRRRSLRLDVALILRSIWISLRGAWPEVGEEGEG
jgi:lipopolysaccharide/colanic/teichoic acid biosynthesis glycosyltransferase